MTEPWRLRLLPQGSKAKEALSELNESKAEFFDQVPDMMVVSLDPTKGDKILTKCCGLDADTTEHYMGTILIGIPETPLSSMKVPKRKKGIDGVFFEME